jgi:hypothetical protein
VNRNVATVNVVTEQKNNPPKLGNNETRSRAAKKRFFYIFRFLFYIFYGFYFIIIDSIFIFVLYFIFFYDFLFFYAEAMIELAVVSNTPICS